MSRHNKPNNQLPKVNIPPLPQHMATIHTQQKTMFDPEIVEKYSLMVPSAPERKLKIFEENSKVEREIRHDQIKTQLYQHVESKRRDWMGYSLALIALVPSIFFAYTNKPIPAAGSFLAFTGMIVTGFIRARKK